MTTNIYHVSEEKMNRAVEEIENCYLNNKILNKYFKDLDYNEYVGHIHLKITAIDPVGLKEILNVQLKFSELFFIEPDGYTSLMVNYKIKGDEK